MKYTAKIDDSFPEQFSSLKAARQWVRESYGRGLRRGESRRYAITLIDVEIEEGFVMNGRLARLSGPSA